MSCHFFLGEYVLANIEKNFDIIVTEFKSYIEQYEQGVKPKFCVNIDNAIDKQKL